MKTNNLGSLELARWRATDSSAHLPRAHLGSPGLTWAHVPRRVPGRLPSGFVRPRGHCDLPTAPAAPPLLRRPSSSFSLSSSPGGDVDEGGAAAGRLPAARRLRKAGKEAPPNEREVPGVGGQGEDASAPRQGPVQGRGEREGDCYSGETSRQVAVTPELAGRYLGEFSIACEQVENGRPGLRATHFPHFNSPPPSNPEVACSANEGTDFRSPTRKWITKSEL